jgi:hypothetical protein
MMLALCVWMNDAAAVLESESECVLPVPTAGVPLSTTTPGDRNCSAPPPDSTGNSGHALVTVYPVVNGIALLGELDKWVNVSPNRFSNLTITSAGLSVDLRGAVVRKETGDLFCS